MSHSPKLFFFLLNYCLFLTLPLSHTDPLPRAILHLTIQRLLKTQKSKIIRKVLVAILSVYVCMTIQTPTHRLSDQSKGFTTSDSFFSSRYLFKPATKPYRLDEGYLSLLHKCSKPIRHAFTIHYFKRCVNNFKRCDNTSTSSLACPFCARQYCPSLSTSTVHLFLYRVEHIASSSSTADLADRNECPSFLSELILQHCFNK